MKMSQLEFEIKRSKFKVTTKLDMVKIYLFENAAFGKGVLVDSSPLKTVYTVSQKSSHL